MSADQVARHKGLHCLEGDPSIQTHAVQEELSGPRRPGPRAHVAMQPTGPPGDGGAAAAARGLDLQYGDLAHAELHGKVAKLVLQPAFAIADLTNGVGPC